MPSSVRAAALHSGACLRACTSSRARCAPATALPRREAVISGISLLTALNVQSAEAGVCGASNLCNLMLCATHVVARTVARPNVVPVLLAKRAERDEHVR